MIADQRNSRKANGMFIWLLGLSQFLHPALFTSGQSNDLCFDPVTNVTLICNENAGCIARGNSTTCTCSSGFTGNGTHCSRKGECHNDTSCPSHSICINDTLGVLMCKCKHGYSKRGAECSEENECAILGNLCHRRASCNNETGLHTCQCVTGFEGNGTFCEDINECAKNGTICGSNGTCLNTIGSYVCQCLAGYTGVIPNCSNVNECLVNNSCDGHAACLDSEGSFQCSCKEGFSGNGTICEDIDECSNQSTCSFNETCRNAVGSYACNCATGFAKNSTGYCSDINECQPGFHGCSEFSECINTAGSYNCVCKPGFTGNGSSCQEIDLCKTSQLSCHGNATCSKSNGIYRCTCGRGFSGNGTVCANIDECVKDSNCSVNSDCLDTDGSYTCRCKSGYKGDGFQCYDINECSFFPTPCRPFDACLNTIGSFKCQNYCQRVLCTRFSSCRNLEDRHVCRCNGGLFESNGQCQKPRSIFFVHGLVLKMKYLPRYGNERSSAFTSIAVRLEKDLLGVYRRTHVASGLASVKVIATRKGSVVVSYYLLYSNHSAITVSQVSAVASNLSLFALLDVDTAKAPRTRRTNLCETGGHGCGKRASCVISNNFLGYRCKCLSKYEMMNGKCRKKRTHVEIIIPSVIGGLLLLFFASLFIILLCKRRQAESKEKEENQSYPAHIERFGLQMGRENASMQMEAISPNRG